MKIKSIRPVRVSIPKSASSTPPRRPSWNRTFPRALAVNFYSEFSRIPGETPGVGLEAVWVQVIADNGTWGLGQCADGQPVAAYVRDVLAPLLEGRNCMAIEHLNDLRVASGAAEAAGKAAVLGLIGLSRELEISMCPIDPKDGLTSRQREVLELVRRGMTTVFIAGQMTDDDLKWLRGIRSESASLSRDELRRLAEKLGLIENP